VHEVEREVRSKRRDGSREGARELLGVALIDKSWRDPVSRDRIDRGTPISSPTSIADGLCPDEARRSRVVPAWRWLAACSGWLMGRGSRETTKLTSEARRGVRVALMEKSWRDGASRDRNDLASTISLRASVSARFPSDAARATSLVLDGTTHRSRGASLEGQRPRLGSRERRSRTRARATKPRG
jgi:hypothetical protein